MKTFCKFLARTLGWMERSKEITILIEKVLHFLDLSSHSLELIFARSFWVLRCCCGGDCKAVAVKVGYARFNKISLEGFSTRNEKNASCHHVEIY